MLYSPDQPNSSCGKIQKYVFTTVYLQKESRGITSSITSSNLVGVDLAITQKVFIANLSNFRMRSTMNTLLSSCAHTRLPYVIRGLTIPVNAHLMRFGLGPKDALVMCDIFIINFLALSSLFLIWVFQWSLLSSSTPRYFTSVEYGKIFPSKCMKCVGSFFFLVKSTATVFSALNQRPHPLPHSASSRSIFCYRPLYAAKGTIANSRSTY